MGVKIELSFLTNKKNIDLFEILFKEIFNLGWRYNQYKLGEYSYCVDAPIYEAQNSITVNENKLFVKEKLDDLSSIFINLKDKYSPSIYFYKKIDELIKLSVDIIELNYFWKELTIFIDYEDDYLNKI